mgnify:FL=1|tara:strand:+ start:264 stop:1610 length:1347 start_codon:yes stop_codon:yes gene_type:complete
MKKIKIFFSAILFSLISTFALADFDWKKYAGEKIVFAYDIHPYVDALVEKLPEFEELTGIKVDAQIFPDDVYWNKLNLEITTDSGAWDVAGTGVQPTWDTSVGNHNVDLSKFLNDPSMTSPDYNYNDIYPSLRSAMTWDVKGEEVVGNGKGIWGLPHSFENMNLMYRNDILGKHNISPPKTLPELTATCKKLKQVEPGITPMALRGVNFWSSVHTAPASIAKSYGVVDYVMKDGKISDTGLDSEASIKFHKDYVAMVKECAAKSWPNDNWYQVVDALTSGNAAMAVDANMFGFWNNIKDPDGKNPSGKISFAPPPTAPGAKNFESNIWIWCITMPSASKKQGPAWYFMQWATSKKMVLDGAMMGKMVNPIRKSTWESADWKKYANQPEFNNYYDTFMEVQDRAALFFTPRYGFGEAMNAWSVAMQEMVNGRPVEETLKELAGSIRAGI